MKHLPAEKAGKDQIYLCGFSRFECGNTDSRVCYGLHLETILLLTKAYILGKLKSIGYLILTIAKGESRQNSEVGEVYQALQRGFSGNLLHMKILMNHRLYG